MTKIYEDLINIIDYEPDKDEELYWEKDYKKHLTINYVVFWLYVIIAAFGIFCLWANVPWGIYVVFIFLIINHIYIKNYTKRRFAPITIHMNACNFKKLLTVYMTLQKHHKYNTKNTGVMLSNIANALFYLGRTEEAKKVVDLAEKYCDTPEGNGYRAAIYAMAAMREKDKSAVEQYVKEFQEYMSQKNVPHMKKTYEVISKYPLVMEAEAKGDYVKTKELLERKHDEFTYQKVGMNYGLYKAAKAAGMEVEAEKHRAFVLANGGDTYYKKELQ